VAVCYDIFVEERVVWSARGLRFKIQLTGSHNGFIEGFFNLTISYEQDMSVAMFSQQQIHISTLVAYVWRRL